MAVTSILEGIGQMRNGNKFLVGEPERKKRRGRPACKFKDNLKVDLKGIEGYGTVPLPQAVSSHYEWILVGAAALWNCQDL
jgi:hypothetical protein